MPAFLLSRLAPLFLHSSPVSLFYSCCSHSRVFGNELEHEFFVSISHTERYWLFSQAEIVLAVAESLAYEKLTKLTNLSNFIVAMLSHTCASVWGKLQHSWMSSKFSIAVLNRTFIDLWKRWKFLETVCCTPCNWTVDDPTFTLLYLFFAKKHIFSTYFCNLLYLFFVKLLSPSERIFSYDEHVFLRILVTNLRVLCFDFYAILTMCTPYYQSRLNLVQKFALWTYSPFWHEMSLIF